jgi:signal transduction histidine kinase
LIEPRQVAGHWYYHAAVEIPPAVDAQRRRILHVLYSEQQYRARRRQVMMPLVAVGCGACLLTVVVALGLASRVARPLGRLRQQVGAIADGQFTAIDVPRRDDEVRQLVVAVNQMASRLADYERKIRHTEQVRTLAQLSGGLTHQLRNSATGARMALDLHRQQCPLEGTDESLEVARRQVVLMEKHLQKFLALGTPRQPATEQLELAALVTGLLPLVQPVARHARVQLSVDVPPQAGTLCGDRDSLEHMVLNLLLNGIEAAEQADRASAGGHRPAVMVQLRRIERARLQLTVEDNGPGPAPEVAATMFDALVTTKHNGVGLGLAVARQAVHEHKGTIFWQRQDGKTRFTVELPAHDERSDCGEAAGRR